LSSKQSTSAEIMHWVWKKVRPLNIWEKLSSCWEGQPFGQNRHWPKIGWSCRAPFCGRSWVPSNTIWPGPRPTRYQVAYWSIQPFGHNMQTSQTDRRSPNKNHTPKPN